MDLAVEISLFSFILFNYKVKDQVIANEGGFIWSGSGHSNLYNFLVSKILIVLIFIWVKYKKAS